MLETIPFNFLGIRVLEGCSPSMRKVLKEGRLYLLSSSYAEVSGEPYTLRSVGEANSYGEGLYNVRGAKEQPISVGIHAVVGKNGEGKSSFVELMLRIINNFACFSGFTADHDTLEPVCGLRAILYYERSGLVWALASEKDDQIDVYCDGSIVCACSQNDDAMASKAAIRSAMGENLFYTLVVNYSLYAYNSNILDHETKEGESWIDALFHKNDSYQTPVVLNPMRVSGNIDINKEEYLSRQRLMALYTYSGGMLEACRISDTQKAEGFAYKLEDESKFVTHTLKKYFHDVRPYHLAWAEMERLKDHLNDKEYLLKHGHDNMCRNFLKFWSVFTKDLSKMKNLVTLLSDDHKYYEYTHSVPSDLNDYLGIFEQMFEVLDIENSEQVISSLRSFRVSTLDWLSYSQLYRLLVIFVVWDELNKNADTCVRGSLDEAIAKRHEPKYAAMLYILYKVIEILQTYAPYTNPDRDHTRDNTFKVMSYDYKDFAEMKGLRRDVQELLHTDDYTTLKLRQTISYLKRITQKECNIVKLLHKIRQKHVWIDASEEDYKKDGYRYISFRDLKLTTGKLFSPTYLSEIAEQLPPPIFEGDIIVLDKNGERYAMSLLSSGQTQLIYSISTMLYHLRNLDCKVPEGKIQYSNVSIIFEEVELYFHPEYQRQFVSEMLKQIEQAQLENIRAISICIVTHSPFVLSDIMRSNSLYLQKGYAKTDNTNETFGANLYDLMQDSFFLEDNAIGVIATEYLRSLIQKKNNGETISESELAMVGDNIISHYLQSSTREE